MTMTWRLSTSYKGGNGTLELRDEKVHLIVDALANSDNGMRAIAYHLNATSGPVMIQVDDPILAAAVRLGMSLPRDCGVMTGASPVVVIDERPPEHPLVVESSPMQVEAIAVVPQNASTPAVDRETGKDYSSTLSDLKRLARWHAHSHHDVVEAVRRVRQHPGAKAELVEAQVERALERGALYRRLREDVLAAARRFGPDAPQTRRRLDQAVQAYGDKHFQAMLEREIAKVARAFERAEVKTSTVTAGPVSHRIPMLAPAPAWTLCIDETGEMPDTLARTERPEKSRFVGLLVPQGVTLPPVAPGWHAVDQKNPAAIDALVQAVLDAPVGVLGLTLEALPEGGQVDAWSAGVLEVVRWVARLLPIEGPTRLSVEIEQRGEHTGGAVWKAAATALMRQLLAEHPRFHHLELRLRLVGKDGSPYNGYADALAFTWGSPAAASRARLTQSGLMGACFHAGEMRELDALWHAGSRGRLMSGPEWAALVANADARTPGSIAWRLLDDVREQCRRSPAYWHELLATVRAHMESKALRLGDLGRQVAELEACKPPETAIEPLLELAWLTARLEQTNHAGATDDTVEEALEALSERLREEAPELVCQADLVRAVLATNRFDFEGARRRLRRWRSASPAEPGLRHWARVMSSRGQHAAFQGDHRKAAKRFDEAIAAFERLSDTASGAAEADQTRVYRAIAAMDDPSGSPEAVRARVSDVVDLSEAGIVAIATSHAAADAYRNHVLVRYLWFSGTAAERAVYLQAREAWRLGVGHPWPVIDFYRALLLQAAGAAGEAARVMSRGLDAAWAPDQGPTVRFIGHVFALAGGLAGIETAWPAPEWERLRREVPMAPWEAVDRAREGRWREGPGALLTRCLPFNFK